MGDAMCILLLEDDHVIHELLSEALHDHGWPVCEAYNIKEATHCLAEGGTRVLIADRNLAAGEDGHVFAREARAADPSLAVIYMSGRPGSREPRTMQHHEWMVPKPFLPSRLVELVQEAVGGEC